MIPESPRSPEIRPMERCLILVCAMVPSIAFLQYGIARTRVTWGDRVIWEAFCMGGLCAAFAILPELLLKKTLGIGAMVPLHGAATEAFYVAAIPEEFAKLGGVLYVMTRFDARATRYDMIMLSLAMALGFAAIENLLYLTMRAEWPNVALSRALTAVPFHGIVGLAMGAMLTAAERSRRNRNVWLAAAIAVPILLHGGYDFPLLLVGKNHALHGVLPAWLLMSVLAGAAVIYLCNRMWASSWRGVQPS